MTDASVTALFAEEILPHLATVSVQASFVAVMVILLRRLLGASLSPRWRHALWVLVLLRLAWPFSIPSPVSLFQFVQTPFTGDVLDGSLGQSLLRLIVLAMDACRSEWIFRIWLVGVILLMGRLVVGFCALCWQLRGSQAVSSWPVWWLLQECKTANGIQLPIALLESPHITSPCILGLSSPKLVLPWGTTSKLSREELRDVFLHELAHIKRSDLPLLWLVETVRALHWFNPIVWYICHRMDQDREEACDEMALDQSEPNHRRAYGSTLLKVLEGMGRRTLAQMPGVARLIGGEDALMRRMQFILGFRHGSRTWVVGSCTCFAVLALGYTDAASAPFRDQLNTHLRERNEHGARALTAPNPPSAAPEVVSSPTEAPPRS